MIGKSIRRKAMRSSYKIADISNIIQETIMGIKIVKAFNMKKKEMDRFIKENFNFNQLLFKQAKLLNLSTPINDLIGVTIAVILLWYGGKEVLQNNNMSSDGFIRYIMFLFAMLQPSRRLGTGIATIQTGIASANRVKSVLDIDIEHSDIDLKQIDSLKNNIEFCDVKFKYENSEDYALKNINISINKGETIALVGKSGSGKTTFSNLLLRYYDPSSGQILIDNSDVMKINKSSLRNIMSVVTQEPILFNDSIKNNITYGCKNVSEEKIKSDSRLLRAASYAKRFASKEACSKALGTGFRNGVFWRDIGVINLPSGKPTLELKGGAKLQLKNITPQYMRSYIHLSITDEYPLAQASVIISVLPDGSG